VVYIGLLGVPVSTASKLKEELGDEVPFDKLGSSFKELVVWLGIHAEAISEGRILNCLSTAAQSRELKSST